MSRLERVRLIIEREIMDGCNDCVKESPCQTHHAFIMELMINPKKYIDLGTCRLRDGVEIPTVRPVLLMVSNPTEPVEL